MSEAFSVRESSHVNAIQQNQIDGNSGSYCEIRNIRIKSGGMCYFLQVLETSDAPMDCTGPVELHSYPESPSRA